MLRRLKTWLRTTLGQERLSQAAVLASYPSRLDELDTEAEMRRFAVDMTRLREVVKNCAARTMPTVSKDM